MNDAVRGLVERAMDTMFEEDVNQYIKWVKDEIPLTSYSDLMTGFMIGAMQAVAEAVCMYVGKRGSDKHRKEDDKQIQAILKRRLPEIVERVTHTLNT